jgi:hypothetical protein
MNMLCRLIVACCIFFTSNVIALADSGIGETLNIYTQFKQFVGKPTWLLIIRDVETGLISPYIFDIRNNENYWIAFTYGHSYRVTVSNLKFGTYGEINNFCGLEDCILSGTSLYMTLKGVLTPDPKTTKCYIHPFKD